MSPTHDEMAFPGDRRLRLWVRPSVLVLFAALAMAPVVAAWVQYAVAGLPPVSGRATQPRPRGRTGSRSGCGPPITSTSCSWSS